MTSDDCESDTVSDWEKCVKILDEERVFMEQGCNALNYTGSIVDPMETK